MLASEALMARKSEEIRQTAELHREERPLHWETPVLSEASLRHFTLFNSTGGDDNVS